MIKTVLVGLLVGIAIGVATVVVVSYQDTPQSFKKTCVAVYHGHRCN